MKNKKNETQYMGHLSILRKRLISNLGRIFIRVFAIRHTKAKCFIYVFFSIRKDEVKYEFSTNNSMLTLNPSPSSLKKL